MLLVIDNYDSFVYNLVQYLGELGQEVKVFRNDTITIQEIMELKPSGIILSPGPGRPEQAGICLEIVKKLSNKFPILGVCLGHQVIGSAFGADVVQADNLMHGKVSPILHLNTGLFSDLPIPLTGGRYHSLALSRNSMPSFLKVTAWTEDGEIMGVSHQHHNVHGVQFHPESVLTGYGHQILKNYLRLIN
ncbi:MAG: aminodeoxychorismate/anthranilate synthase component II [Firmicutes bacterium]|nr:aminodeoxychorismate/anthranilate synthase component II [Bacillota bacterium]